MGDWLMGKKHGEGVYYYNKSNDVYVGEWSLQFKDKTGVWYKNGIAYEGDWKNGEMINLNSMRPGSYDKPIENIIDFYTEDYIIDDLAKNYTTNWEQTKSKGAMLSKSMFNRSKNANNNLGGQVNIDLDKLDMFDKEQSKQNYHSFN